VALVVVRGRRVGHVGIRRLLVVARVVGFARHPAAVGEAPGGGPKDAAQNRAEPGGDGAAAVVHEHCAQRVAALEASARLAAGVLLGVVAVVLQAAEPAHERPNHDDQHNELGPPRAGIRATQSARAANSVAAVIDTAGASQVGFAVVEARSAI